MRGWALRVLFLFLLALAGKLTLHDGYVMASLFVLLAFIDLMRTVEQGDEREHWNNKNGGRDG